MPQLQPDRLKLSAMISYGARNLAEGDKFQFQWWAVSLVEAEPFQGKKKGADTGIDGIKFFRNLHRKELRKIVVTPCIVCP